MNKENSNESTLSHPNIIICMCDQLRAFEVHCYGNEVIQTPNIDRLAAEGVRFDKNEKKRYPSYSRIFKTKSGWLNIF